MENCTQLTNYENTALDVLTFKGIKTERYYKMLDFLIENYYKCKICGLPIDKCNAHEQSTYTVSFRYDEKKCEDCTNYDYYCDECDNSNQMKKKLYLEHIHDYVEEKRKREGRNKYLGVKY